jgi:hypothetical protein
MTLHQTPHERLASIDRLWQALDRAKRIAAFFKVSRDVPASLTGTLHTAAVTNPSTYKAMPWQCIGEKRQEFLLNPDKTRKPTAPQRNGPEKALTVSCRPDRFVTTNPASGCESGRRRDLYVVRGGRSNRNCRTRNG